MSRIRQLISEVHRRSGWQARGGRRGSFLLTLCVLAAVVLGCARDRSQADQSTITILYHGNERITSPSWDMPAQFLVFMPLAGISEDGGLMPGLARSWEHSPDHRTWTFHLRSDVRWHDGVPFTAHDVKFTFDLWQHPEVLSISGLGASVAVLDDTTFTVT